MLDGGGQICCVELFAYIPLPMPRIYMSMSRSIFAKPDYTDFVFRAEVDYLVVRIDLEGATNFQTVRRRLGDGYVMPVDAGEGGATRSFRAWFNAPQSWQEVVGKLKQLQADYAFSAPPRLAEIELSFDAYSKSQNAAALLDLTHRFFKCAKTLCSDNYRMAKTKGTGTSANTNASFNLSKLERGYLLYIGNKDDVVSQRVYFKRTDNARREDGGYMAAPLPKDLHRARTEVAFRDLGDSLMSLEDAISTLDFKSFAHMFKFRQMKADLGFPPVVSGLYEWRPIVGARAMRRDRTWFDRNTKSDLVLNDAAYQALLKLTRRMRAAPRKRARNR